MYRGLPVRLMAEYSFRLVLSHFGLVNGTISDLILIKSVVFPELKTDDLVIVNDISQEDKDTYGLGWGIHREEMVQSKMPHKIDDVRKVSYFGLVVKINDEWFFPYHLEPVISYDMI